MFRKSILIFFSLFCFSFIYQYFVNKKPEKNRPIHLTFDHGSATTASSNKKKLRKMLSKTKRRNWLMKRWHTFQSRKQREPCKRQQLYAYRSLVQAQMFHYSIWFLKAIAFLLPSLEPSTCPSLLVMRQNISLPSLPPSIL